MVGRDRPVRRNSADEKRFNRKDRREPKEPGFAFRAAGDVRLLKDGRKGNERV
jgi:hypothetical protein